YGSADPERGGQRLSAEIRSVNHRFCEVSVPAPQLVGLFEDQIPQLIADRFSRGKVNPPLTSSGAPQSGGVVKVNQIGTQRYVALLEQLKQRYRLDSGLDVRTLAALPDVFTWEHTALSDDETWGLLKAVIGKACDNMNAMKAREGESLARDLVDRLGLIR